MTDFPNIRIYFQMRPDSDSLQHLIDLQAQLPPQLRGYAVPSKNLHLTLIHFGKAHDTYEVINKVTNISYSNYDELLQEYIFESTKLLPTKILELQPSRFSLFGPTRNSLVIEYHVTIKLKQCHDRLFEVLCSFLTKCGVTDVEGFVAADSNFVHALTLRPHITLFKGYAGDLPDLKLESITVESMPTVYTPLFN